MTYPAARYHGDGGEVSATLRRYEAEPDFVSPGGTRIHYLATGKTSDGEVGLYRYDMSERPGGPEPHFHRTISESFFVLDGTVRLYDGDHWVEATRGDFLFVPEGGIHGFRNDSGQPASMLILFAPGAPREAYVENVAQAAQLSPEDRARFFDEHDTYWV
jgi:mannose-6-phosphate isomerase-like protein (cupin superfamily)